MTTTKPTARAPSGRFPATLTFPRAMLLTTASTSRPSTSSMTAAARMIWLDLSRSSPLAASTCAVIPTLVATIAAPTKMASICGAPQRARIPQPRKKGSDHAGRRDQRSPCRPLAAARRPSPPARRGTAGTSRPGRPASSAGRWALIQPSTLGPISTPARISPTIPGCPSRSQQFRQQLGRRRNQQHRERECASAPPRRRRATGARSDMYPMTAPPSHDIPLQSKPARARAQQAASEPGPTADLVQAGFCVPSRISRRISCNCLRASEISQRVRASSRRFGGLLLGASSARSR